MKTTSNEKNLSKNQNLTPAQILNNIALTSFETKRMIQKLKQTHQYQSDRLKQIIPQNHEKNIDYLKIMKNLIETQSRQLEQSIKKSEQKDNKLFKTITDLETRFTFVECILTFFVLLLLWFCFS